MKSKRALLSNIHFFLVAVLPLFLSCGFAQAEVAMETSLLYPNHRNLILPGALSPEIRVEVTLDLNGLTLDQLEVIGEVKSDEGTIAKENYKPPPLNHFNLDIDLSPDTPAGDYDLVISLYRTGEIIPPQQTYQLKKISQEEFASLTSYIDGYNRFILNGEPFFPLGLYVVQCPNGSYSAQLDEIADSPFDTLMNYGINECGTDATDAQILSYLDQLELRNLKLIFYLAQYLDGAPFATATWTFDVALDGDYNVYAWWDAGLTRATDAPYTVNYSGGSETIRVSQKINGSQWNLLGMFSFVAGTSGSIVLSNDADELVIADAVKVEGAGPLGSDIIMDEELATFTGTWNCTTGGLETYNGDRCAHARFFDDIDAISHKVDTFKTHPAVISWYLNDERDLTYLPQLEERYQRITELDENHPVWSVHWYWYWLLQEAHTTDIVGMNSYPIDNDPITAVSYVADKAMGAGKLLWFVPQIFNWQDYPGDPRAETGRPPTREEMRAMSYLAINHGAKGLVYYSYFNMRDDVDYDVRWPEIKEIANEIDQLRQKEQQDILLSIHQTNDDDVSCENSNIDHKLMRMYNTYYLLSVNTAIDGDEEPIPILDVEFSINMELESAMIDVLFEEDGGNDRKIPVLINGQTKRITDDFGPYDVHVYKWEAADDKDGDGFDSQHEWGPDGADPNYDGDGDGKADSEYANAASGPTYDGQHYVTLAVPDPASLSNSQTLDNPHPGNVPARREFPFGFFGFEVTGLASQGDCTEATIFLPKNSDIVTYWRYGPTPGNPANHWYEFIYDGETGAEVLQENSRTRIVLHLCDGMRGDDDLVADGTIVDAGGPAAVIHGGGGGGGSCFISTMLTGNRDEHIGEHMEAVGTQVLDYQP